MPSLRALAAHADVALAVTQPPRPAGRGMRVTPTPVAAEALALGIATAEPERLRDVRTLLEDARADVFALASYGKISCRRRSSTSRASARSTVHPSLLPLYRGATPLQSTTLRDGRAATGVTIILMDAGMDTGDIVLQEPLAIAPDETYGTLHDRCAALGARLLVRAPSKQLLTERSRARARTQPAPTRRRLRRRARARCARKTLPSTGARTRGGSSTWSGRSRPSRPRGRRSPGETESVGRSSPRAPRRGGRRGRGARIRGRRHAAVRGCGRGRALRRRLGRARARGAASAQGDER